MTDTSTPRRMMVDGQVRTNDVTDHAILAAMLDLPRERFVPPAVAPLAYLDLDVPVNEGAQPRRMLKPMVLAKLLQAADIDGSDTVLVVGCGTGYSAALLSRLAGSITALEEDATLARQAKDTLAAGGAANVTVVTGSLAQGWAAGAPYDVILLDGAVEVVPDTLLRQLKDSGRLLGVLGSGPGGKAILYRQTSGHGGGRPIFDAAAPLLPGFTKPAAFAF